MKSPNEWVSQNQTHDFAARRLFFELEILISSTNLPLGAIYSWSNLGLLQAFKPLKIKSANVRS